MMNLNQRITALRNYKRLTQDQVAEVLGVKRARYNAWENGIANPDHTMLAAIARFHGVTVDFLLGLPHPEGDTMPSNNTDVDGYTEQNFFRDLARELERNFKATKRNENREPETLAAHHESDDWTEEELAELERFKEFIRMKRKK